MALSYTFPRCGPNPGSGLPWVCASRCSSPSWLSAVRARQSPVGQATPPVAAAAAPRAQAAADRRQARAVGLRRVAPMAAQRPAVRAGVARRRAVPAVDRAAAHHPAAEHPLVDPLVADHRAAAPLVAPVEPALAVDRPARRAPAGAARSRPSPNTRSRRSPAATRCAWPTSIPDVPFRNRAPRPCRSGKAARPVNCACSAVTPASTRTFRRVRSVPSARDAR